MNQQTPYAPRWARIIGRSGTLIGIMAVLGALTGAIFGALSTQAFTSVRTLLVTSPTCAAEGAICGGPAFSSPGWSGLGTTTVTFGATARTAARAQTLTGNDVATYMSAAASMSYLGDGPSVAIGPATLRADGTAPGKQVLGDVLLGLVCGTLVGALAALAGGRTTIDPLAADDQWQRAAERSGLIRDWSADGATNLGISGPER